MKTRIPLKLVGLLAVLLLVAAACGGGDDTSELPINPNPDDTTAISSACAEGEPDCDDTVLITDEPIDVPNASGGMLVDGGLTVSEALATDATGSIAVKGFLVADDKNARLCEVLAESLPPQCGGASIVITGYEGALNAPVATAQGISWTDEVVSVVGEIIDGTLVITPISQ